MRIENKDALGQQIISPAISAEQVPKAPLAKKNSRHVFHAGMFFRRSHHRAELDGHRLIPYFESNTVLRISI
jgi:hypothetical protein